MIEGLPHEVRRSLRSGKTAAAAVDTDAQQSLFHAASPLADKILPLLRVDEATQVDDLIRNLDGVKPAEVLAALSELELFGAVRQMPGKSFVRIWTS